MQPLRPIAALMAIAALITACSSPVGTSGGESSAGSDASQPAATTGDGGGGDSGGGDTTGGGGSGANGSITYELSGDVDESGELPFVYLEGGVSRFVEGGWVAYFFSEDTPDLVIQINSNPDSSIFNYGNGQIVVSGTVDQGCSFDFSQNDASGLVGTIDCASTLSSDVNTGEQINVQVHAEVDAHS
ncbi:MAG: hypothetical protein ACRDGJ_07900 [Candidatus Limnocylindria bacterium]